MTNPLILDKRNRLFYEALIDLHTTDVSDDSWLEKFRKVRRIKQLEDRSVIKGWRCFYQQFGSTILPLHIAEFFY